MIGPALEQLMIVPVISRILDSLTKPSTRENTATLARLSWTFVIYQDRESEIEALDLPTFLMFTSPNLDISPSTLAITTSSCRADLPP